MAIDAAPGYEDRADDSSIVHYFHAGVYNLG